MNKRIGYLFYLLISAIFIKNEEVDDGCNSLGINNCNDYKNNPNYDGSKECLSVRDDVNGKYKCRLHTCEDIKDEDMCFVFDSRDKNYNCMKKKANKNNKNKDVSGCQLLQCTDLLPGYCRLFKSDLSDYICIENETFDGCKKKKCSEMDVSNCDNYNDNKIKDDEYRCLKNEKNDGCEYKKCEELKPGYCKNFDSRTNDYQCTETDDGKSCSKRTCSNYSPPNCQNFITQNLTYQQCLESGNTCLIQRCEVMIPPDCGKFIPENPLYICTSYKRDNKYDECIQTIRKCEELSYDKCHEYYKSIYFSKGENCVQKEDKGGCELQKCEEMNTNKCDSFYASNNNEKCQFIRN